MKNKILTFLFLFLFTALAQAQTTPAVTLTFLDNAEILDSCSGCTNPYQSFLFTGVKVTAGSRVTYVDAPYSVRRYGTSRLKFEIKSAVSGNSARFAYGQVNSTTYPSATRLYDALRVGQERLPGLYTILTDTTVTTLTNAHVDNVVNYAATQLTHTLNLPATPHDGQICRILFNSIVTNLTIGGNSTTLRGTAATSAVVGTRLEYRYLGNLATPTWLRQL
jgi:hypothetical protein